MPEPLVTYDEPLESGTFRERRNRFSLAASVDGENRPVYLRNSGGLETVLRPGREMLLRRVDDADRKTDFDAIAVDVDGTWVTLDSTLPNAVFEACVAGGRLPQFDGYDVVRAEPALPDAGRSDFLLDGPDGDAYVEVKSNTYVVDGVSKFPDRPTERGRRHLRSLTDLARDVTECHVVFVIQRPDADRLHPFREVDPEFADLLGTAAEAGVEVGAVSTRFDPPAVNLHDPDVPVEFV
ncbi:DNA/RNA nuclease SfsA [Natronomonas salina]|uniref:DNA/RNA nuclease SfsA n=1 Tax=Natronomonas salina TaxID=1710540 RepID=UPI0015B468B6|nr:DNA/RNA nuclease SfsA [Natronomonas salina]QLD88177.1 DNA/RNA nuclease SfsA [Natronomonas salina]